MAGATKDGGSGIHQGGTAHFVVDPDRLVKLRNDIEALERDVYEYVRGVEYKFKMKPPGADPVSFDTAAMFTGNGDRAIEASKAFHQRLKSFRQSLDASIKRYHLMDEAAERSFEGRNT